MINVITLCSGYDSQCMALERIKSEYGLDYNLVAWSEIDKYVCQAHDAVFPQFKGRNLGDMTTIDWSQIKEDIDLLIYSTPCQSISNAGLQHGFAEGSGTRSSIIWSTLDAIDALRPKYLLLENVKAMVSKKFMPDFKLWCKALEERDYTNFWQVLNAKNYGIPQNRERVFLLSTRDGEEYEFPKPFELEKRLKDVLEKDVDESYYLSDKSIVRLQRNMGKNDICVNTEGVSKTVLANSFKVQTFDNYVYSIGNINPSGNGMNGKVFSTEGLCPTITTNKGEGSKILEPISCAMRGRNPENPSDRTSGIPTEQRIELSDDIANCITTVQKDSMVAEPRIIQVGNLLGNRNFNNPQIGRIYSSSGISPNIDTFSGGNREHKIIEPLNADDNSLCRTIKSQYYKNSKANFIRDTGSMVATGATDGYRIRKLTPREVFRLMGVTDENIDKIQSAGISKTQQYKMAGNSIVVDVLFHIFRKLFVDKEASNQYKQLKLF